MKINQTKRFLALATVATLLVLFLCSAANAQALKTTVGDILANPNNFDGKMVQVEGKVLGLKFKTSRKGNPYTTFKLNSNGKNLSVFSFNHLPINEAELVRVIGRYQKVKHVGRFTFYNEIDASGGSVEKK
jgi:hypothetical protein